MGFEEPWERIQRAIKISKYVELAEILGITQQSITKAAKKNFPIKWAFTIAQKYNLSTDWIMTGKEPTLKVEKNATPPIILELEDWIAEAIQKDSRKEIWFEVELEKNFEDFAKWREKKKMQDNKDSRMAA